MKQFLHSILILAVSLLAMACSGESTSGEPQLAAPVLQSQSIAEGAVIATADQTLTLTYSAPISVADAAGIQLNGKSIAAKASGVKLTVSFTPTDGTDYTFTIAEGALCRYGEPSNFVAPLTIHFSTAKLADLDTELCDPAATAAAKQVYGQLLALNGRKTLSGVMANVNNNNEFSDVVYNSIGKHPALTCYDFIHLPYSPASWIDYSNLQPALTQWKAGGIVSYMWHWLVPPTEGAAVEDYSFEAGKGFDIREALKEGTWQNRFILADIDRVAVYLKQLQDEGVAIVWRPLHEAAGHYDQYGKVNNAWFWWGEQGTQYTKQLWQLMYDRLVHYHGLHNLIWTWTVQVAEGYEQQALEAYPGDGYVDVVGTDIYAKTTNAQTAAYHFVKEVGAGRKLVALTECGNIPDPDKGFAEGSPWSWFMVWYSRNADGSLALTGSDYTLNTLAYWQQLAKSSHVAWREDLPKR